MTKRNEESDQFKPLSGVATSITTVGINEETRSRLPYWKWKAEVILRILEHPAMGPDGDPGMYPDFDCLGWEEDFLSGMTIEDEYQKADDLFNKYGW